MLVMFGLNVACPGHRFRSILAVLLAMGLVLLSSGCPGNAIDSGCMKVPGCDSRCCDASNVCRELVCEGLSWICLADTDGSYRWLKGRPSCPLTDTGPGPVPDGAPRPDSKPLDCGKNATVKSGACVCVQGYLNTDKSWSNGCEAKDPACGVWSCGHCPAGYCGPHAHCLDNVKCRCNDKNWKNKDTNWGNGCEFYTPTCSPTNCNACYHGFCSKNADCRKNSCKCIVSGWTNCDGTWELSGCECNKTCVSGKCQ